MQLKTIFQMCYYIFNIKLTFAGVTFTLWNVLMYSISASIITYVFFKIMD